ncbi:MAG: hypothetical protein GC178_16970 [Flavobacteriales bacterium]|nr:hypothetical protein [Flavobacteriales bacterium]
MMLPLKYRHKYLKYISILLLQVFLNQLFIPSALALTSGPNQPEFSSFEPVATTNMVNEYTGDFTYNLPVLQVPGPDGSSYSMSLSYHSGTTPEEESSWVGYGWTLNPGAITRNKRGFPDDWNNQTVTFWNKTPANTTFSLTASANLELFSALGLSAGSTVRLNNYTGFATSNTFGLSFAGAVSLGYTYEGGDGSFSLQVNPKALLSAAKNIQKKKAAKRKAINQSEMLSKIKDKDLKAFVYKYVRKGNKGKQGSGSGAGNASFSLTGAYGAMSYNSKQWPDAVSQYKGVSVSLSAGGIGTPAQVEIGVGGSVSGSINFQKNKEFIDRTVFGYMYSDNATQHTQFNILRGEARTDVMDYYVEKGGMYSKRDKFIGIPFSNADVFSVSGEGIGGAFRPYNKSLGSFSPSYARSTTTNIAVGIEGEIGLNMGGGGTFMGGENELIVSDWPTTTEIALTAGTSWIQFEDLSKQDGDYQTSVMRFTNDLGGAVLYNDGNTEAVRMNNVDPTSSLGEFNTRLNSGSIPAELLDRPVGRSSYIGYTLVNDMAPYGNHENQAQQFNQVNYRSYQVGPVSSSGLSDSEIGEFSVVNAQGMRYTYAEPILASNENKMSYDMVGATNQGNGVWTLNSNHPNDHKTAVGQISLANYASTYLLTSITTPDYIDRDMDGFTDDDFGGYTVFEYETAANDYHWRMPYHGVDHIWNSLSDPKDDLGTFVSGDKQVKYLKRIETKTHYALFKTSVREDARSAPADDNAISGTGNTSGGLKQLDRIELWSKGSDADDSQDDRLIKVVHFDYNDDSGDPVLWGGTPNSDASGQGRLMLEKVWFESRGIVNGRVAPYEFGYTYPQVTYPQPYGTALDPGVPSAAETPDYQIGLDPWGNYQKNGYSRENRQQLWVDQNPPTDFDPAAWQLKNITLPSGGQIHVQYEQDDYAYVQNQEAHAFVPIISSSDPNTTTRVNDDNVFVLNLSKLHLPDGYDAEGFRDAIIDKINRIYVQGDKKLFFKHLYRLVGQSDISFNTNDPDALPPWEGDCSMDYIDGYCRVSSVSPSGTNVQITLASGNHTLPGQVCLDFVKTQREGMLDLDGQCDPTVNNDMFFSSDQGVDFLEVFGNFVQSIGAMYTSGNAANMYCLRRSNDLSYFRIPVVDKLGGGLRVKRLLMYDPGMRISETDNEPATVYGTEYIYRMFDDEQGRLVSSGVATSEPAIIRDECVLMQPLPRGGQTWLDRVISGKDRKQMEGPIGESVLPSPSVGYRQVISRSIYRGQTDQGFKVSNYLTAKEYPMKVDYTPLSSNPYIPISVTTGFVNISILEAWLSQGFAFKKFDAFYGKEKATKNYSGDHNSLLGIVGAGSAKLVSSVINEYFEPEDDLPVFKGFNTDGGNVSVETVDLPLGREMDVAMESKIVMEHYMGISTEFDIDFGLLTMLPVIIPQGSGSGSVSISRAERRANATSKVISYPAVVSETRSTKDQFTTVVQNIALDQNTGTPLITRTNDEYNGLAIGGSTHDGLYTSYSLPAGMYYPNMNQMAENERVWLKPANDLNVNSVTFVNGPGEEFSLEFEGDNLCDALSLFTLGSMIEVHDGTGSTVGHVTGISGNTLHGQLASFNPGIVTTQNGGVTGIHVLRSGNTNVLGDMVGKFTTYGEAPLSGSYTPISSTDPNYQAKHDFVVALNNAMPSGSVDMSNFPSLQLSSPLGCYTPDDDIHFSQHLDGAVQMNVGGGVVFGGSTGNLIANGGMNLTGSCSNLASQSCVVPNLPGFIENELDGNSVNSDCIEGWEVARSQPSIITMSDWGNEMLYLQGENRVTFEAVGQLLQSPLDEGSYTLTFEVGDEAIMATDALAIPNLTIVMYNHDDISLPLADGMSWPAASNLVITEGPWSISGYNNAECNGVPDMVSIEIPFVVTSSQSNMFDQLIIGFTGDGGGGSSTHEGIWIDNVSLEGSTGKTIVEGCSEVFPPYVNGDGFALNEENGLIEYRQAGNDCFPVPVNCLQFCNDAYPITTIDNVVSSSAHELSDIWDYNENLFGGTVNGNIYQKGIQGKWRSSSENTYLSSITGLDGSPILNHEAGVYQMDLFNWKYPNGNDPTKWLKATEMTAYSPNGNLIEEQNILGIKSCAKFGYGHTMPILVANNASGNSVMFESFEKVYDNGQYWEGGLLVNGTPDYAVSHSGQGSVNVSADSDLGLYQLEVDQALQSNSLRCKLWLHFDDEYQVDQLKFQLGTIETEFRQIALVGDWVLCQADLSLSTTTVGMSYQANIHNGDADSEIWIDDVVIHPLDASINTYVYDISDLKLIASMDDQHFALLYQYSPEGKLTRKLKETVRGVKTVAETYYNTPIWDDRPITP